MTIPKIRPVLFSLLVLSMAILSACSTVSSPSNPSRSSAPSRSDVPVFGKSGKPGGYYQNDGPGDTIPPNLDNIPDAVPKIEPLAKYANRPYQVFGQEYVPEVEEKPFRQKGGASWYGKQFHGQKTSSGETYNMYEMTAAHKTLPLPSYVRVTNQANGKQVIVRVNDRGPFHPNRIIDLSYAAANKLGYAGSGSAQVEIERILPMEIRELAAKGEIKGDLKGADSVATDDVARSNPYVRSQLATAPILAKPGKPEEAKVQVIEHPRASSGRTLPEVVELSTGSAAVVASSANNAATTTTATVATSSAVTASKAQGVSVTPLPEPAGVVVANNHAPQALPEAGQRSNLMVETIQSPGLTTTSGSTGNGTAVAGIVGAAGTAATSAISVNPNSSNVLANADKQPGADEASMTIPEYANRKGVWLQLGVFSIRNNAEDLKNKIAMELAHDKPLEVVSEWHLGGFLHKLVLGPFTDRNLANEAALRVARTFNFKPLVVERK